MKRKNWFYRMMLSYTPIFFVVISSIIFIFFLVLNNTAENKYRETTEAILERVVHNTDVHFMLIERNVVSQLLKDRTIQSFFSEGNKSAYQYYDIQNKLIELKSTFPFQNTIYLYNEADERIVSDSGSYSIQKFGDREFLQTNYALEEPSGWNNPRPFTQMTLDDNQQHVVSLVKYYYDGDNKVGAVAVNVYLSYFIDYLNSFNESGINVIQLADATFHEPSYQEPNSPVIVVSSDYTGWEYAASGVVQKSYNVLSHFSKVWMIIVVMIIVIALIGFTLVTHMHYKPIESILEKVGHFSTRKSEDLGIRKTRKQNEFAFIEMALDQLIKKSLDYENLFKEDSMLRKQKLLHDLLSGHQVLSQEQFKNQLSAWNVSIQYDRLSVIVAEIDDYSGFTQKYKLSDQHLLKFIVENAFHELGHQNNIFVWHAWMEPERIAFVTHHLKSGFHHTTTITELAEELQRWVQLNLELTISIGVGADSDSIISITESYQNAKENVSLKTIFGTNTIIDNRRTAGKLSLDSYAYLQVLESAAQSFRMNESDWREKLTHIFNKLREMRFGKSDMNVFVYNFLIQIEKVIATLSPAIQEGWKNDYQHLIVELTDRIETLDKLEEKLMTLMSEFEAFVDLDRQARRHHSLALQAKSYIDANYANPDLSLTRVSEYLNLQPSTLSQLFKEELGGKFID
ncbi:cache domain-containing protein [Paenibacillus crassostreae]|uniref:cache domain-containing protein n=1 Tax=Paenibacillus crassostreae TaxID=1763538 RepID=UPI000A43EF31|nr:cache domain-containing protein [Paenibacillus crassostreae]